MIRLIEKFIAKFSLKEQAFILDRYNTKYNGNETDIKETDMFKLLRTLGINSKNMLKVLRRLRVDSKIIKDIEEDLYNGFTRSKSAPSPPKTSTYTSISRSKSVPCISRVSPWGCN